MKVCSVCKREYDEEDIKNLKNGICCSNCMCIYRLSLCDRRENYYGVEDKTVEEIKKSLQDYEETHKDEPQKIRKCKRCNNLLYGSESMFFGYCDCCYTQIKKEYPEYSKYINIKDYDFSTIGKDMIMKFISNTDKYMEMSKNCDIIFPNSLTFEERLDTYFWDLKNKFNTYSSSIFSTPLSMKKPMSSSSAGIFGTIFGGLGAGILAANRADRQNEKYNQHKENMMKSETETEVAKNNLIKAYCETEGICCRCLEIWKDWNQEKLNIINEKQ